MCVPCTCHQGVLQTSCIIVAPATLSCTNLSKSRSSQACFRGWVTVTLESQGMAKVGMNGGWSRRFGFVLWRKLRVRLGGGRKKPYFWGSGGGQHSQPPPVPFLHTLEALLLKKCPGLFKTKQPVETFSGKSYFQREHTQSRPPLCSAQLSRGRMV